MSLSLVKNTYTRQPQIGGQILDWGNHLTKGLVQVALPNGLWSSRPPPMVITNHGKGIIISGSSYGLLPRGSCREPIANSTVFTFQFFTALPAWNSGNIIYQDTDATWPVDLGIKFKSSKSYGQVTISVRDTGGATRTASDGGTDGSYLTNNFVTPRIPFPSTAVINPDLSVNLYRAKQAFSVNTSLQGYTYNPPASTAPASVMSGTLADDSGTYLLLALRYNRALSREEVYDLHDNPWQIFRAPRRRIYVPSTSWFHLNMKNQLAYPNAY